MTNFFNNLLTVPIRHVPTSDLRDFLLSWLAHLLRLLATHLVGLLVANLFALVFAHLVRHHNVRARYSDAVSLGHRYAHLYLLLSALLLLFVPRHLPVLTDLLRYKFLHRFLNIFADGAGDRVALLFILSVALLLHCGHALHGLYILADHPGHLVALLLRHGVAFLFLAGLTLGRGHVLALVDWRLRAGLLAVFAFRAHLFSLVVALPVSGGDAVFNHDSAALLSGHLPAHVLQHGAALPVPHRAALLAPHLVTRLFRHLFTSVSEQDSL